MLYLWLERIDKALKIIQAGCGSFDVLVQEPRAQNNIDYGGI